MKGVLTGFTAWLLQRASAVFMVLFIIFIPLYMWQQGISGFHAWREALASPVMALIWALFFLSLIVHAWVGVRDVIIDYVHGLVGRLCLLGVLAVSLISMLLWVLGILLMNSGVEV